MSVQAQRYPLPLAPATLAALVPCSSGAGCPLGVDVPAIANAVRAGDHAAAYALARGPNPFASTCGHGCHAPCESACRCRQRGAPVAIAALEAYAAGFALPAILSRGEACSSAHDVRSVTGLATSPWPRQARLAASGKRVAIVGGGAAGLACAHDLALLGHRCVVFDEAPEPGGLLTRGIPDFRFPIASARAECALVLSLGVEFRGGTRVEGADALRDLLAQGFDAVFVAIGASAAGAPLFAGAGEHAEVHDAMSLLMRAERPAPGRVVVIGDGDLAVDAARVIARRGKLQNGAGGGAVALVLTSPIERSVAAPAMLGGALRDGVALHDGWTPRALYVEEGRVVGVELERDEGRTAIILPCDTVVTAAPRVPAVTALGAPPLDGAGHIAVDPDTMHTALPGIWAGGACVGGHRSIAHATADGKRAAWQIHSALTGEPVRSALLSAWVEANDRPPAQTAPVPLSRRAALPLMAAAPLDPFSPSALPSLEEMQREAARCYDCAVTPSVDDGCTLCGVCVRDCPESAFSITGEPRELKLDQDRCTRCGICADRCPEAVITMVRAVWEERLTTRPRQPESAPLLPEERDADEGALTPR